MPLFIINASTSRVSPSNSSLKTSCPCYSMCALVSFFARDLVIKEDQKHYQLSLAVKSDKESTCFSILYFIL